MSDEAPTPALSWRMHYETELTTDDHTALAALLRRIYPEERRVFTGEHSWSGARPEQRLIGYLGDDPVAHLGILRRFIRARDTGHSVLVGDVGLVGVDPNQRGLGLGGSLLARAAVRLAMLGVDFGTLTTSDDVVPYYESGGWRRAPNPVLHAIDLRNTLIEYDGPTMFLPVGAPASAWPTGPLERNGQEV